MSPCDGKPWVYDLEKKEWNTIDLKAQLEDAELENRSYHVMTTIGDRLFRTSTLFRKSVFGLHRNGVLI